MSLIHSRFDFGNFTYAYLVGLPAYLQRQLQSVLNAAARVVFWLRRFDHITDTLVVLHWLPVPQRVDYKVVVMAFRALNGLSPPYVDQLVRVADLPGRHHQRSSDSRHQSRRRSRAVHCVASISSRSIETSCSHRCTDHSSQMPTSTRICSMLR